MKKIFFDMDGTIADLYGVENWLDYLIAEDDYPYAAAKPMINMSLLARYLNKLRRQGWTIGIISWTSKGGSDVYNEQVALTKISWLHKHLPSVIWDDIKIVNYGTNKRSVCGEGILFDDEEKNRITWGESAYTPDLIMQVLSNLLT